ncbi:MAG: potassium channel protein [bacterium]|nr:potassium channel protein [bacterium]
MPHPEESTIIASYHDKLRHSLYLFITIVSIGTIGYKVVGGSEYSFFDCFYMTIITLSTVGYGEIIDLGHHPGGRLFTVFLIILGMGVLLYVVSNITAFIVEGELLKIFWRRKMDKMINKMNGHYIVCGVGKIGYHIIRELCETNRQAVVIDMDMRKVENIRQSFPNVPAIQGEGIEDDILKEAAIEKAAGIIVATGHDKDNMVITMTARQLNPSLRIVTRCNDQKNMQKLDRAGADTVVSSNFIGGLRMVSELVRPTVVSFLDIMLRDKEKNLRIEEVPLPESSAALGKEIAASGVRNAANALLLAVKCSDGTWAYNPKDDFILSAGMKLVVMGSPEEKLKLEAFVGK